MVSTVKDTDFKITPLQVLIAAMPFFTGVFYEWQSTLVTIALSVIILYKTVKTRKITIDSGLPLFFALSVVVFNVLTAFWAVDKGMVWLGVVKFLPLPLFIIAASGEEKLLKLVPHSGALMTVVSLPLCLVDKLKGHIYVSGRLGGFFEYPNVFAMFLLVCLILVVFKEKLRSIDPAFIVIYLAGIVLSGSKTVIALTAVTAIVYIVWVKNRKMKLIALSAFALAFFGAGLYLILRGSSNLNLSTFYGRLLYFRDALPVILKHPFGLGYYGYYYTQGEFQTGVYSVVHIHNDLLQILLDIGWIPAVIGVVMVVKAFIKADLRNKVLLAMISLHLLFDFDMQFIAMAIVMLAIVFESSESKQKVISYHKGSILYCSISVVLTFVSIYFGLASFFNYTNDYRLAAKIYPAYTEVQKVLLIETSSVSEMGEISDSILKHNPDFYLANSAKSRIAFSSGDVINMMDCKEKAIRYNKYSKSEYIDYLDMLSYSLSLYLESGDYQSAQYCVEKCFEIENEMKNVESATSSLGRKINDQPDMELPEEYVQFLNELRDLNGV